MLSYRFLACEGGEDSQRNGKGALLTPKGLRQVDLLGKWGGLAQVSDELLR